MKIIRISNNEQPEFDRELIASLPASGPRYTSYPTADRFHKDFNEQEYIRTLELRQAGALNKPLSLYIHIPFCDTICYYCGCNKIITKDKTRADEYLNYLEREMDLLAPHLNGKQPLAQLHFGGGTPTFLSDGQLNRVFAMIHRHFNLLPDGEYSIEIDPRKVSRETVLHLGRLGFNRMSVGIQDFDPKVQQAVNRIQTVEETRTVIDAAREAGFKSVSVDLIYGLPHQSLESIKPTIDTVPNSEEKLDILQYAVQRLTEAGYVFIGMDHFAKPDDELSVALREGFLQRNFQGYSTYADCDLIAIGVSAIGKIGSTYEQNERNITDYYAAIDQGRLPIMRGYRLNKDDILRRNIIQDLMCRFALDFHVYQDIFGIPFEQYFATELEDLKQMAQLGLVKLHRHSLQVTPKGRFLIRNIAMVFDYHLRHRETTAQYSQTV